jgi:hypothetical protein
VRCVCRDDFPNSSLPALPGVGVGVGVGMGMGMGMGVGAAGTGAVSDSSSGSGADWRSLTSAAFLRGVVAFVPASAAPCTVQ